MTNSVKRAAIVVAALLPILVLGWFVLKPEDSASSETVATTSPSDSTNTVPSAAPGAAGSGAQTSVTITPASSTTASVTTASVSTYNDGTYTANASYNTPGGPQDLGVSITLKSDVITEVTITEGAKDAVSQKFQDQFAAGYKVLVVGKNIDDVQLTKVSGSSLTPGGFNDALNAIKVQAEV